MGERVLEEGTFKKHFVFDVYLPKAWSTHPKVWRAEAPLTYMRMRLMFGVPIDEAELRRVEAAMMASGEFRSYENRVEAKSLSIARRSFERPRGPFRVRLRPTQEAGTRYQHTAHGLIQIEGELDFSFEHDEVLINVKFAGAALDADGVEINLEPRHIFEFHKSKEDIQGGDPNIWFSDTYDDRYSFVPNEFNFGQAMGIIDEVYENLSNGLEAMIDHFTVPPGEDLLPL